MECVCRSVYEQEYVFVYVCVCVCVCVCEYMVCCTINI